MAEAAGRAVVEVPATSANLGPGFDTFGLALELRDRVEAHVIESGLEIEVTGEGADSVSGDESHLVVQAMRLAFDRLDVTVPGLRLVCHNAIPHGRGLGSSSAAIVAGILLANALAEQGAVDAKSVVAEPPGHRPVLDSDQVLAIATELEGHGDNVAACLSGGFTIAWTELMEPCVVSLPVEPRIEPVVFIPPAPVSTDLARGLLPTEVAHADASANAARTALMVVAMTQEPALLLNASEDWLHQDYRRPAMPESLDLVYALRGKGIAAMISGAGPTVLALNAGDPLDLARWTPVGWRSEVLAVAAVGARLL